MALDASRAKASHQATLARNLVEHLGYEDNPDGKFAIASAETEYLRKLTRRKMKKDAW